MSKVTIKEYNGGVSSGGKSECVIDNLEIVCDTSKGKQEVLVYINNEVVFGRDFSRVGRLIKNHVQVYDEN